jgi:hypothetical protein
MVLDTQTKHLVTDQEFHFFTGCLGILILPGALILHESGLDRGNGTLYTVLVN